MIDCGNLSPPAYLERLPKRVYVVLTRVRDVVARGKGECVVCAETSHEAARKVRNRIGGSARIAMYTLEKSR